MVIIIEYYGIADDEDDKDAGKGGFLPLTPQAGRVGRGRVINNVSGANNFTLLKICSVECTLKCMMYTLDPLKTIHCDEHTSHTVLTVRQNQLHCFKAAHCSISQPNMGHVRSFYRTKSSPSTLVMRI